MSPLLVFGRGVNSISFNQRPIVLRDFVGTCCTTPATFVKSGFVQVSEVSHSDTMYIV